MSKILDQLESYKGAPSYSSQGEVHSFKGTFEDVKEMLKSVIDAHKPKTEPVAAKPKVVSVKKTTVVHEETPTPDAKPAEEVPMVTLFTVADPKTEA